MYIPVRSVRPAPSISEVTIGKVLRTGKIRKTRDFQSGQVIISSKKQNLKFSSSPKIKVVSRQEPLFFSNALPWSCSLTLQSFRALQALFENLQPSGRPGQWVQMSILEASSVEPDHVFSSSTQSSCVQLLLDYYIAERTGHLRKGRNDQWLCQRNS